MPRVARAPSPARADSGSTSSPSRPRRNLKRTASQALPPTPPRTIKRERKRRPQGRPAKSASKPRSPTRSRSRGLETILEESEEGEEEIALGPTIGRRLDFGPAAKRRRLEELDARLETLLESLDGEDAENPFWDGPVKAKATESVDTTEKGDVKKNTGKKDGVEEGNGAAKVEESKKDESTEKIVRIRSPSPPLLSFRGRAPVSPPPSNRRKKKVRGKTIVESVIEEKDETEGEPSTKAVVEQPSDVTAEPSTKPSIEPSSELAEESAEKAALELPSESTSKLTAKPSLEPPPELTTEAEDELPVIDLPPMPSTPKKGKRRMDTPIRDSPNNPFLDDSPASVTGEPAEPRTPTLRAEKPTITYVFRGVRAEFANPMYNLPPEVHERSLLPLEHPDYSPDPACPPKLLFTRPRRRQASPSPTRRGRSRPETRSSTAAAAPSAGPANGWDDSDDEAELHITPPKRLFH